ncbi:unnamed protein product [Linum trigynum]|uniref:Uncharacterized protein n=1 Tax=Linum trigynum TaxID=586398 RepID=A0AAV2GB42_9ROSI
MFCARRDGFACYGLYLYGDGCWHPAQWWGRPWSCYSRCRRVLPTRGCEMSTRELEHGHGGGSCCGTWGTTCLANALPKADP